MKLVIFDWGRTLYNPETGTLFPETKKVLEYLKSEGYTLAIVALATAGQVKIDERLEIIEKENLAPYFASIKFAIEDKDKMYEETVSELGFQASATTVVDDRVVRGIKWGNQKGCKTIWIQNGKFAHELPSVDTGGTPTHTVSSIGELLTIL